MEIEGILFVILTDETASPLIENKISSGCVVIALLFFNSFIFILEIFFVLYICQKNIFISKIHS